MESFFLFYSYIFNRHEQQQQQQQQQHHLYIYTSTPHTNQFRPKVDRWRACDLLPAAQQE